MALVSTIINRSLRLLGAIDPAADTPALDSQTAIVALNSMCTRWEANGLAMGWANVDAVDDTMPSPDEAEEAIVYNLAVRLAPEYAIPAAMPGIADMARQFLSELRRDRIVEMPLTLSHSLPASLRGGQWDITNDDYA